MSEQQPQQHQPAEEAPAWQPGEPAAEQHRQADVEPVCEENVTLTTVVTEVSVQDESAPTATPAGPAFMPERHEVVPVRGQRSGTGTLVLAGVSVARIQEDFPDYRPPSK